jgi:alkylated DNA repair dioxygenase AlkB
MLIKMSKLMAIIREYDADKNHWTVRQNLRPTIISSPPTTNNNNNKTINNYRSTHHVIHLRRGGTIKIYPNLISHAETSLVKRELFQSGLFRQYKIQTSDEPRAHFLLHEDATDDYDYENDNGNDEDFETRRAEQPGYRYANSIMMKARPLSRLPRLERLAQELARHCQVPKWTIGVNPVLYRDGQDKMGDHADNDQGEQVILALLVDSPTTMTRKVKIRPFTWLERRDGDEQIELFMQPGDAYEMDGKMQESYSHSVPPTSTATTTAASSSSLSSLEKHTLPLIRGSNSTSNSNINTRIAIVFRTGDEVRFSNDSGRPCLDLSPRIPRVYTFGRIAGLQEGELYTRTQLFEMGAHGHQQRGISGQQTIGCDALVVSGLRTATDDEPEQQDELTHLVYNAEASIGALSVVMSYTKGLPIRIFRSSRYKSPYRALVDQHRKLQQYGTTYSTSFYRYDGVYVVNSYIEPDEPLREPYEFYLRRTEPVLDDDDEPRRRISSSTTPTTNVYDNESYMNHCEELGTIPDFETRDFLQRMDVAARTHKTLVPWRNMWYSRRLGTRKAVFCQSRAHQKILEFFCHQQSSGSSSSNSRIRESQEATIEGAEMKGDEDESKNTKPPAVTPDMDSIVDFARGYDTDDDDDDDPIVGIKRSELFGPDFRIPRKRRKNSA